MKVRRLHMTSFRGFRELTLEFKGPVTVLVGTNGAGKTSVLDCLQQLLLQIPMKLADIKQTRRASDYMDIQNGADHTFNSIEAEFNGTPVKWSLALNRKESLKKVPSQLIELDKTFGAIGWNPLDNRSSVPLSIYYSLSRAPAFIRKSDSASTQQLDLPPDSDDLLFDSLTEGGGDFRDFFRWFRRREDLENEKRIQSDTHYRDIHLQAVRASITRLLPGFSNLRVQRSPLRMIVQKESETLEIDQLSAGERCLLAMAGDISGRLATAYPGLEDPSLGEAVIMIDEIELHLHPGWQRVVVERLQKAFPNCQFILTTHSPQVLSQIPAESVILLEHFQRVDLPARTQGRDSNAILSEVMGVPEWPPATTERIHTISQMIDREEIPQARAALDALALQLGEHDSEVVRLRSLIEFLGV